jgi:hypothetical protein
MVSAQWGESTLILPNLNKTRGWREIAISHEIQPALGDVGNLGQPLLSPYLFFGSDALSA